MYLIVPYQDSKTIAYKITFVTRLRSSPVNDPGLCDDVFISAARYVKVTLDEALQANADGTAFVLWLKREEGYETLSGYEKDAENLNF